MASYQGRAMDPRPVRQRGRFGRWLRVLGIAALLVVLAHLPWEEVRKRVAVVSQVDVEGTHYLDSEHARDRARIHPGDDLFRVNLARARQLLLLDSRVAQAQVQRRLPRSVRIQIVERLPVLLVDHGEMWELGQDGVLLEPLQAGVVADVPRLVGPQLAGEPAGTHLGGPAVERGLSWARVLAEQELQLAGQVSEVDVSDPTVTSITLVTGTRVLAPPSPPSLRRLSALRVVLTDLSHKGTVANEVDLRFENQVIVRPVATAEELHAG